MNNNAIVRRIAIAGVALGIGGGAVGLATTTGGHPAQTPAKPGKQLGTGGAKTGAKTGAKHANRQYPAANMDLRVFAVGPRHNVLAVEFSGRSAKEQHIELRFRERNPDGTMRTVTPVSVSNVKQTAARGTIAADGKLDLGQIYGGEEGVLFVTLPTDVQTDSNGHFSGDVEIFQNGERASLTQDPYRPVGQKPQQPNHITWDGLG
jgi:hypothetical protein